MGPTSTGVAITVKAEQEGTPYADYVGRWREDIERTFERIGVRFDVWSGTSVCPHHADTSLEFFRRLGEGGYLNKRTARQLYCTTDEMFLADRYVEGTCPECGTEGARGDECPKCASWLDPLRLIDPRCKVCGSAPEERATAHWYLATSRNSATSTWDRGSRTTSGSPTCRPS